MVINQLKVHPLSKFWFQIVNNLHLYITGGTVGEAAYSMPLNQYTAFLYDCEIPDGKSKFCKMKDCDVMFITTNYEENKDSAESDDNDDLCLMRFEFLEIIVRVAIAKFGRGQETDDVSDSIDILAERNLRPCLCPEALIEPNDFREARLYCEEVAEIYEMNEVRGAVQQVEQHIRLTPGLKSAHPFSTCLNFLKKHTHPFPNVFAFSTVKPAHHYNEGILGALYDFYKAPGRGPMMGMDHWLRFLDQSSALGKAVQVDIRLISPGLKARLVVNPVEQYIPFQSSGFSDMSTCTPTAGPQDGHLQTRGKAHIRLVADGLVGRDQEADEDDLDHVCGFPRRPGPHRRPPEPAHGEARCMLNTSG